MTFKPSPKARRPPYPECKMRMITVGGFGMDMDRKTFECLHCGHVEKPGRPFKSSQVA
jgi:hypothetical protein